MRTLFLRIQIDWRYLTVGNLDVDKTHSAKTTLYHPFRGGEGQDELVDAVGGRVHERDGGVVQLQLVREEGNGHVLRQQTDHADDGDEPGANVSIVKMNKTEEIFLILTHFADS
jgi:hypothetical protein